MTGVAHLFDLRLGVSPQAEADELRLLTFSDLYLADRWGRPLPRLTLAGAVQTIPFAALALEVTSKTAGADGTMALRITLAALDRQGHVMRGCRTPVQLGAYWYLPTSEYETGPNAIQPTSPSHVILRDGVWSGRVTIADPPTRCAIAGLPRRHRSLERATGSGYALVLLSPQIRHQLPSHPHVLRLILSDQDDDVLLRAVVHLSGDFGEPACHGGFCSVVMTGPLDFDDRHGLPPSLTLFVEQERRSSPTNTAFAEA